MCSQSNLPQVLDSVMDLLCDPDFIFETLENVLGDSPPTDLTEDDADGAAAEVASIGDKEPAISEGTIRHSD